jgi:hypothetical protein
MTKRQTAYLNQHSWSFRLLEKQPMRGYGLVLIGPLFLGLAIWLGSTMLVWLAAIPWDLPENAARTRSVGSSCDAVRGARYQIEVAGVRYQCTGGDNKCGLPEMEVLYDPADPSRCRLAKTAGRVGPYELLSLAFAASALLVGSFSTLMGVLRWRVHRARLLDEEEAPPSSPGHELRLPRAIVIAERTILGILAVLQLVIWVAFSQLS